MFINYTSPPPQNIVFHAELLTVLHGVSDMVSAGVESMEAKIAKVTATQAGLWQHQENIGSNQATILSELHTLKQSLHKLTAALPTSNTDPPAEA